MRLNRNLEIGLNLVVGSNALFACELDRQRSAAWKKRAGFCPPLASSRHVQPRSRACALGL